jgi:F0F1-type ATP synthase membrane subunit a
MNSLEPDRQSEHRMTINIKSSVKNQFIARTILIILLSTALGIFYAKDATDKYQKGSQLTQEKYLENFDRYKNSLMTDTSPQHPALAIFISLMMMSFLIGSYELASLAISLAIGKILK